MSELRPLHFVHRSNDARKRKWYGNRLKIIRVFYDKTTFDVSNAIGVTSTTINEFETNEAIPNTHILNKLCEYFEVSENFFIKPILRLSITDQRVIKDNKIGGNKNLSGLKNHGK